jgi:hypothetical protein
VAIDRRVAYSTSKQEERESRNERTNEGNLHESGNSSMEASGGLEGGGIEEEPIEIRNGGSSLASGDEFPRFPPMRRLSKPSASRCRPRQ